MGDEHAEPVEEVSVLQTSTGNKNLTNSHFFRPQRCMSKERYVDRTRIMWHGWFLGLLFRHGLAVTGVTTERGSNATFGINYQLRRIDDSANGAVRSNRTTELQFESSRICQGKRGNEKNLSIQG